MYNKTNWEDNVTPVNAVNLQNLEDGIESAHSQTAEMANLDTIEHGINLLDTATDGYEAGTYLNTSTGLADVNASYNTYGYIAVNPGDVLVCSTPYGVARTFAYIRQVAAYDANKANIISSRQITAQYYYIVPSGVAFVRLNIAVSTISPMVEKSNIGLISPAYETPYSRTVAKPTALPRTTNGLKVFLPSEICVAVGRTIEIYNAQVCPLADVGNYHFRWHNGDSPAIGVNGERKYTVTGTTPTIGTHALSLYIYDDNNNQVYYGRTNIKIVADLAKTISICPLGDSLSSAKPWLSEVQNLSGGLVSFVGDQDYSVQDANGVTRTGKHAGRSGWAASDYLTTTSPFWDGTRFNWAYYVANSLGGVAPNAVHLWLGTNAIADDPYINATNIKKIVDYIRQDSPSMPIYLVYTIYQGGMGNPFSCKLSGDYRVFNLAVMLTMLLSSYTNLHFVPLAQCHDTLYNHGWVSTPVNPRASQTEYSTIDNTHPQNQGYYQIADVVYSSISAYA
jgi:hypothetical protein